MHWDWEALNRYVLVAIGVLGTAMYCGLLCTGIIDFKSRLSKSKRNNRRSRNRPMPRRLRD